MSRRPRTWTRPRAPAGRAAVLVGARLREVRAARGLSQSQVGAPYYGRQAISAVELGRSLPSLRMLRHLAGRLETSVRDLLPADF
jgi:transcriptional regulator with XRE-family HTH domain